MTMTEAKTLWSSKNKNLDLKVTVKDSATPIMRFVEKSIGPVTRAVLQQYGKIIKRSVAESFQMAKSSSGLRPATIKYKAKKGLLQGPLQETGRLQRAITDLNRGIEVEPGINKSKVRISWDFPTAANTGISPSGRKNNDFLYVTSVEDGITKGVVLHEDMVLRQRNPLFPRKGTKFLEIGIKKGIAEGNAMVKESLAKLAVFDPSAMSVPIVRQHTEYTGLDVRMTPTLMPHGPLGVIVYLIPPSYMYKYIGMSDDFMGAWSGTFDEIHIYGYIRQFLWGKTGVTKKTIRRKWRRKLYGEV